ncbi:unnamed protein product [Hermetia illucens]|uniref:Uncharacterized protein n=1 Tax=Hermetia illucens TaxID=343691 RepID=A0A7R8V3X6_HERIL|nr:unnamed protein product [Hermetia illucens]
MLIIKFNRILTKINHILEVIPICLSINVELYYKAKKSHLTSIGIEKELEMLLKDKFQIVNDCCEKSKLDDLYFNKKPITKLKNTNLNELGDLPSEIWKSKQFWEGALEPIPKDVRALVGGTLTTLFVFLILCWKCSCYSCSTRKQRDLEASHPNFHHGRVKVKRQKRDATPAPLPDKVLSEASLDSVPEEEEKKPPQSPAETLQPKRLPV